MCVLQCESVKYTIKSKNSCLVPQCETTPKQLLQGSFLPTPTEGAAGKKWAASLQPNPGLSCECPLWAPAPDPALPPGQVWSWGLCSPRTESWQGGLSLCGAGKPEGLWASQGKSRLPRQEGGCLPCGVTEMPLFGPEAWKD